MKLIETLLKNISKIRVIKNLKELFDELKLIFEDYSYSKLDNIFKDFKNI